MVCLGSSVCWLRLLDCPVFHSFANQKVETASNKKRRASAMGINAEIRRTKARKWDLSSCSFALFFASLLSLVKGLSGEEVAPCNNLVLALPDLIHAILDGEATAPKQSGAFRCDWVLICAVLQSAHELDRQVPLMDRFDAKEPLKILDAALQKVESALNEKSRASAVAINAEIRQTKTRLLRMFLNYRGWLSRRLKGYQEKNLLCVMDLVLALPDRIEAIPDAGAAAPKQSGDESNQFRQEYKMCKMRQDQVLEVKAEGLDDLKTMAHDMNEELDRQVHLMDAFDARVDKVTSDLENTNVRPKDTVNQLSFLDQPSDLQLVKWDCILPTAISDTEITPADDPNDFEGLYRGSEDNEMCLGICSRSNDVVEPLIKLQWYVNCKGTAKLWWGHQIPVWYATLDDDEQKEIKSYSGHWLVAGMKKRFKRRLGDFFQENNSSCPKILICWTSGLHKRLEEEGNLDPNELKTAKEGQVKDFPNSISKCGADALHLAQVTEELWQCLPARNDCARKEFIVICDYPSIVEIVDYEKKSRSCLLGGE
ncbi:hypothetical protein ACH5RR_005484 [Cinchona calisaya]|uniref:valine--tRNA ligase n=1 Tax=Cinchona calisaya TaxID=153742 RepID=A0ABD3ALK6_9GENT